MIFKNLAAETSSGKETINFTTHTRDDQILI